MDTFVFEAGSLSTAVDAITDFSATDGDKIDLSSLLGDYDPTQDAINNFVTLTISGSNTILAVDAVGTGSNYQTLATLSNVHVTTSVDDLITAGNLVV